MRTPRWPLTAAIALSLTLTACSGETEQAGPSPEPSTSASAATQQPTSGSATPAPINPPGEVPDPCAALTKEEATKVVGHDIKTSKTSDFTGSKLCAYTAVKAGKGASITTQVTPLIGELDSTLKYITGQFEKVKTAEIEVAGASEARLITGELVSKQGNSNSNAVDVVMVKDGVLYQVLVADSKIKTKELTKIATQGAEAMLN